LYAYQVHRGSSTLVGSGMLMTGSIVMTLPAIEFSFRATLLPAGHHADRAQTLPQFAKLPI
jgi:hypothetical protein